VDLDVKGCISRRRVQRNWRERGALQTKLPKGQRLGWYSLRRQWATEMKDTPLKDLCYMGGRNNRGEWVAGERRIPHHARTWRASPPPARAPAPRPNLDYFANVGEAASERTMIDRTDTLLE